MVTAPPQSPDWRTQNALPSREEDVDDGWWRDFWTRARALDVDDAASMLKGKEALLCFHTVAGDWCHMDSVLLLGDIVQADENGDANATVDTRFHADDWICNARSDCPSA